MRHLLLLLLLPLLGGCVTVLPPPAEFASHGARARVRYVSDAEAMRLCGVHPANGGIGPACASPTAGNCVITVGETAARAPGILEHERAHCDEIVNGRLVQGWRHY